MGVDDTIKEITLNHSLTCDLTSNFCLIHLSLYLRKALSQVGHACLVRFDHMTISGQQRWWYLLPSSKFVLQIMILDPHSSADQLAAHLWTTGDYEWLTDQAWPSLVESGCGLTALWILHRDSPEMETGISSNRHGKFARQLLLYNYHTRAPNCAYFRTSVPILTCERSEWLP